jgi:hypothetical protein
MIYFLNGGGKSGGIFSSIGNRIPFLGDNLSSMLTLETLQIPDYFFFLLPQIVCHIGQCKRNVICLLKK